MADFDQYGHYIGRPLPQDCVRDCSASGDVYPAVDYWQSELKFEVPRDKAIAWLRDFGAWEDDELAAKSDVELAQTVLWLACCDVNEGEDWIGLIR